MELSELLHRLLLPQSPGLIVPTNRAMNRTKLGQ